MGFRHKILITTLKCIENFFAYVIPIIIAGVGMNNFILFLLYDVKFFAVELLLSIIGTLLIASLFSKIIDGINKRKFFEYCKENEVEPTIPNWNYWLHVGSEKWDPMKKK